MPVTKKKIVLLPQLVEPIKHHFRRVSSTAILVLFGICGTIVSAILGMYNPSVLALFAALAGFFAAITSTAIFKTQETQAEILNHRRKLLGPLVHRSRALLESKKANAAEFGTLLSRFAEMEDSEHFAFISDELQGMYLDCVAEGEKCLKILTGQTKVTAIPNDFGITAEMLNETGVAFRPLARLLRRLIEDCRREAKVSAPLRTLRMGRERTVKIGHFVLYVKFEEESAD